MRVRMLNPDSNTLATINRDTCPVRIDINDDGLPKHPAFRWHERALDTNPWIRRRFGHFTLIDPVNEEVFGVAFGPRVDFHLMQLIQTYYASERGPALPLDAAVPERLASSLLDPQFMTAYELSFDTWIDGVQLLAAGDDLAPGVRNLSIHVIADLLNSTMTPDYMEQCRGTGRVVQECAGKKIREAPADHGLDLPNRPLDLYERSAIALVLIADLPFELRDPELVAKVRTWWSAHEDDEAFEIEFSDDPTLRYAFTRS